MVVQEFKEIEFLTIDILPTPSAKVGDLLCAPEAELPCEPAGLLADEPPDEPPADVLVPPVLPPVGISEELAVLLAAVPPVAFPVAPAGAALLALPFAAPPPAELPPLPATPPPEDEPLGALPLPAEELPEDELPPPP